MKIHNTNNSEVTFTHRARAESIDPPHPQKMDPFLEIQENYLNFKDRHKVLNWWPPTTERDGATVIPGLMTGPVSRLE